MHSQGNICWNVKVDASRKEVAMTFYDMLNPGGYVFLGHAEYMSRIVSVYKAKKVDQTLIYQK